MRAWTIRWTGLKTALTVAALSVAATALLQFPEASATGMRRGLAVCADLLIPSLFPFLVLSGVVTLSGLSDRLAAHLHGWTGRLFGLPDVCAPGLLVGFVGGYPAGALAVTDLVQSGRISAEEGRRMLRFCVNGGPAFLIGTVGVGLLGSAEAGSWLLVAHWSASLCIGFFGRRPSATPASEPPLAVRPKPLSVALTESVSGACRAMVGMSGFVVLATSFLSVLDAMGLPPVVVTAVSAVTEVSVGCTAVCRRGAPAPLWLGLILGWGGLSVHGQIAASAVSLRLLSLDFVWARLAHAALGGAFSLLIFQFIPLSAPVSVSATPTVQFSSASSVTGGVALLGLCGLWLLTVHPSAE